MSQTPDSIMVAVPGAIRTVVASDDVTRIAVSEGRSRVHGARRGMTYGAAIVGGAATLLFTAAYIGEGGTGDFGDVVVLSAITAVSGAIYGAAIGGLIGHERWSTVYSAPIRVSLGPSRRGSPGVGLSIRF